MTIATCTTAASSSSEGSRPTEPGRPYSVAKRTDEWESGKPRPSEEPRAQYIESSKMPGAQPAQPGAQPAQPLPAPMEVEREWTPRALPPEGLPPPSGEAVIIRPVPDECDKNKYFGRAQKLVDHFYGVSMKLNKPKGYDAFIIQYEGPENYLEEAADFGEECLDERVAWYKNPFAEEQREFASVKKW